jgi:hypothetical protein
VIGTLHVGQLQGEITELEFTEQIMRVKAAFGHDQVGHMAGACWITGSDGTVCWRGSKTHDYGTKTTAALGASVWHVTLDVDLYDRTSVSITAIYDDPPEGERLDPADYTLLPKSKGKG